MRALWIVERFPPQKGGVARAAGRQVAALAGELERLDVLQLSSELPPGRLEVEDFHAASLHRLGRAPRDEESLRLLLQVGLELGRAAGSQLVHGFYATHAGHVAALLGRWLERPSAVSLRGNDVELGMFQGSRAAPLRFALESATVLLGVSREILDAVRAWTGRCSGLHFVPNGVDAELFCPGEVSGGVLEELGGAPRPWLGFSGQLRFKKGLSVLLELAEGLAARDAGTLFAIGGGRSDERETLLRWRAARPAASRRLLELPYRDDPVRLVSLYRAMDLMLFPSLWDGMPNALLEAMACGRPVVAAAAGGIRDAVADGETGILVPLTQLDQFPEVVERVLAQPGPALAALGRRAREHVREHLPAAAELTATLEVYRSLLAA
jgi:glycosyltransferase involved in cell wall biosynthesis